MLALLLVLAWLLGTLAVGCYRDQLRVGHSLREAVLVSCTGCAALVVAITECLSAATLLSFGPVLACWSAVNLGLLGWVCARRRLLHEWAPCRLELNPWQWLVLAVCAGLLALTGAGALGSPPNNWDSMLCHMPRQVRWIQQAGVAHFPTVYVPQNAWPPFAEYVGVHLMILSGSDAWANCVQWFALAMAMVAVSLIARDLGLNRTGQLLAALFVITNPNAFLQSLNTKGDLVACLWLCTAAWWAIRPWAHQPWKPAHATLFGSAVGLLILTKGTGYCFAVPVVAVAGLGLLVKRRAMAVTAVVLGSGVLMALNAGHWTRNQLTYGSPIGPRFTTDIGNETHEPRALASNVIRNIAVHLGTSRASWNTRMTGAIDRLHHWLGFDMNDPRTTLEIEYCGPFQVITPLKHEDTAPAPVHVLLLLGLTLLLPLHFRRLDPAARLYLAMCYGCALAFCAAIKWWPWHARLHPPILSLFAVVLAAFCTSRLGKKLAPCLVLGLLLLLVPYVREGKPKALLGKQSIFQKDRLTALFALRPGLKEPTRELVNRVMAHHPAAIGLCGFFGHWEYPLEQLLLEQMDRRPFFTTFDADAPAMARQPADRWSQAPDLVIGPAAAHQVVVVHPGTGRCYVAAEHVVPYTVYLPMESVGPDGMDDAREACNSADGHN